MSRSLTIGFFTDTYLPEVNGVVTSLQSATKALRRRGHRVIIVAPSNASPVEDDPDVFRFRSTPFPFYPQFRMAFPLPGRVLATLPRMPFDVIHAHSLFFISCLGAYLAQARRIPLALTYHTRLAEYAHYLPVHHRITGPQVVWLSREFANRCDFVVAPTQEIAKLLRSYGVETKLEIVPTGVDMEVFRAEPEAADDFRARHDGPIALFAGRLSTEKNIGLLIDAFAGVRRRGVRATLVIAGEGPQEAVLRARVAELALQDCVVFTGAVAPAQLGALYRAADAFVFPSTSETQGLVLIEAMAHGVPVVAVDCPVSREVVRGAAGLLVERSPEALAAGIVSLLAAPSDERARRRAAALAAAAPFSSDAIAERLELCYQRALDGAAARA